MPYAAPTGAKDILPEEWPFWRHIEQNIQRITALYGFEPLGVPIFESTALFTRGVGEGSDLVVQKEMYSFQDKSGDELTLRPEFTAGIMRAYVENGMHTRPAPLRLYAIGPIFRQEKPQAGRYRIHHQFNVEALGEEDPVIDVEVMSIAWDLYDALGFKGLSFMINSTGCRECRPAFVQALRDYFAPLAEQLGETDRTRLARNPLRLLDSKDPAMERLLASAPVIHDFLCESCRTHFATLRQYLDLLGRPYTINPRLVRGLDYYVKTVFEVWAQDIGAQAAVCGGGRYDGLIEALGGPAVPGVGFGSGIERIILALKAQGVQAPALPLPLVMLVYRGPAAKVEAIRLLQTLRQAGIGALLPYRDSLKAQLKQADRARARFALILGDDELAAASVTVRDLTSSQQVSVPRSEVIAWLRAHGV
ncbi:MAG: histidine--tRNA ligase [Anaerolineae bacterium]|jgi:histidyl-tRNA synthetase|uniref:histidine--tRNA ligase n=1 Tax=Candidatus Amarolinea dominans TaxID=3140696 RepID=UPI001D71B71A|nr:histidine--tRNA ligase [Anaerolineae bacterium]MBK7201292.1 histidine--tRNA ligase [Anaerolineae bacterium]MBK9093536.1 histidine--tRNA ligase [Anaerolineae bacterium]